MSISSELLESTLSRTRRLFARLNEHLPRRLGKAGDLVELVLASGELQHPLELLEDYKNRKGYARLDRLLLQFRAGLALVVAHEAGVFRALHERPRSEAELAEACGIHRNAAESVLRLLESEGAVVRRGGRYALSRFGRRHLVGDNARSFAPVLGLMAAHASALGDIKSALATGSPPPPVDIFSDESRYLAVLDSVNNYLSWAARDLLFKTDLPRIRSFIVGSMGVSFSRAVLDRFPGSRVTYGCLPHLVCEIPRLRRRYRVPEDRVDGTHSHAGDPRQDRWGEESYDLVLLTRKMMLRPEQRLGESFVKKAFEVLRPGGVAILWEAIHPDTKPTPFAHAMEAVLDLMTSPSAQLLTEHGLTRTLRDIGFERVEIVRCLGGSTTFAVARRP